VQVRQGPSAQADLHGLGLQERADQRGVLGPVPEALPHHGLDLLAGHRPDAVHEVRRGRRPGLVLRPDEGEQRELALEVQVEGGPG
jgi:hypothetical protein